MIDPFAYTPPDPRVPLLTTPWSELPVLASTSFCMDILLQSTVLDLKSLEEILTFDPCALLRIFRQTALNTPDFEERPQHLDECIVALGSSGLRLALATCPSTWQQQAQLQVFAEHSTAIARAAELLAGTVALPENTAFLVGAFHELGTLPTFLQEHTRPSEGLSALHAAEQLCLNHHLPEPLHAAILAVHKPEQPSTWSLLIEAAHQMVENVSAPPCGHMSHS